MKRLTLGLTALTAIFMAACSQNTSPASTTASSPNDANDIWSLYASPWDSEREAVVKTGTGLEYIVLKAGPTCEQISSEGDRAIAHYEGRLTNGELFDTSFRREEPLNFWNNQVIAGWREGISLMCPGDDWLMYIPSDLAYGQNGSGNAIGPDEDLIFRVVLLASIPKGEWTGKNL